MKKIKNEIYFIRRLKIMLEKMREIIAEQLNCDEGEINVDTSFKDDLGADNMPSVHSPDHCCRHALPYFRKCGYCEMHPLMYD